MTKVEFGTETQRWYSGGGRIDDLTPERLAVLWERYGSLPLNVWRNAVSKALLEPRWPSAERLDALVGKAEDWEQTRISQRRNLEARAAMNGLGYAGIVHHIRPTNEFTQACKRITEAVLDQHLTPSQTAGLLEVEADATLSLHGQDVREWHAALVAAGDNWANFPVKQQGLVKAELRLPEIGL